jgi:hypothetical protein
METKKMVLSKEQMLTLKELGIDDRSALWCIYNFYLCGTDEFKEVVAPAYTYSIGDELEYGRYTCGGYVRAFDVDNLLDLLPARLKHYGAEFLCTIEKEVNCYRVYYKSERCKLFIGHGYEHESKNLLDALFNIIVEIKKEGYEEV